MIVVDIESSGVDPRKHSIISIGAIDFTNPTNRFYTECRVWDGAHIDDEALAVNGFSKAQITDPSQKSDKEALIAFLAWSESIHEKTLMGQNVSFDRDFLEATAHRYHINWTFAKRTLDLHSICYFDMLKREVSLPMTHGHSALNLDAILSYVGITAQPKPHNALTDAVIEAESFGRLFYEKPYLAEFSTLKIPWQH